ncbi:MAG TPA: PVC-type heme-binding CxxCH protein, partial [Planctomycetota bacterium]|nr:PVC-type heme-binding CxxCH protein [Planctomycetota bacterium]
MHGFPRLASILIALLSISPAVVAEEEDDAELARALERIPPTPASEAKSTFRLHPDFVIELVASEPDVIDPVDMAFDENGRAFVVEMRDYPFTLEEGNMTRSDEAKKQPNGRIRLLEDTDGDGSFDRSRVFVDDLHWPTGVACYKGGVVIAQAPVILYAADRDGDGKADEKRVLFEGFGTRNVQALVNGLEWGPDVRLWALNGG